MVLVTQSLVPRGFECILLGAFCHRPEQAYSLLSPCRLCWRKALCVAACCEHWRESRSQGLKSPLGTPCQTVEVSRRLIIWLLRCLSVRRKTRQMMGRWRMTKYAWSWWSKPPWCWQWLVPSARIQPSPVFGDPRVVGLMCSSKGNSPPEELTKASLPGSYKAFFILWEGLFRG